MEEVQLNVKDYLIYLMEMDIEQAKYIEEKEVAELRRSLLGFRSEVGDMVNRLYDMACLSSTNNDEFYEFVKYNILPQHQQFMLYLRQGMPIMRILTEYVVNQAMMQDGE